MELVPIVTNQQELEPTRNQRIPLWKTTTTAIISSSKLFHLEPPESLLRDLSVVKIQHVSLVGDHIGDCQTVRFYSGPRRRSSLGSLSCLLLNPDLLDFENWTMMRASLVRQEWVRQDVWATLYKTSEASASETTTRLSPCLAQNITDVPLEPDRFTGFSQDVFVRHSVRCPGG